jgi:hypothetical protein
MPECQNFRYRIKVTPVRYRNATVTDWDAGNRNIDAGGIGLDADAQLCHTVYSIVYKNFFYILHTILFHEFYQYCCKLLFDYTFILKASTRRLIIPYTMWERRDELSCLL